MTLRSTPSGCGPAGAAGAPTPRPCGSPPGCGYTRLSCPGATGWSCRPGRTRPRDRLPWHQRRRPGRREQHPDRAPSRHGAAAGVGPAHRPGPLRRLPATPSGGGREPIVSQAMSAVQATGRGCRLERAVLPGHLLDMARCATVRRRAGAGADASEMTTTARAQRSAQFSLGRVCPGQDGSELGEE